MSENSDLEKRIPVFTVLKNHSILKNIFILDPFHEQNSAKNVHEFEETLWIGRHPDCNIILEHPSISRFHLQIHFNPYYLLLSVTDLSSVHGTWVCGNKIEPNVRVYLNEGATLRLGGSSRIYRLHWVPMSIAYDLEQPFVPPMDLADLGDEKELEAEESQTQDASRDLDYVLSDMKSISSLEELITSVPLIPTDDAFYAAEGVEKHGVSGKGLEQNETTKLQLFNEAAQDSNDKDALVAISVADQSQMVSLLENPGTTSLRSAQKTALSTWSGRGICASVQESIPSVPLMTVDNAIFVTEGVENHGVSGNGLEHSETSELQLLNEANQASNDKDAMGTLSFADQSPMVSLMENPVTSPSRSAEKPALSIWSRGICASNEVFSWKAEESRSSALAESEVNSTDDDVTEIESISRNLFPSENDEDDKENYGSGILSADDHYWTNSTLENPETPPVRSAHKSSPFIWSKRGKSARVQIATSWVGPDTEVLNSSDHDTHAIDSITRDLCSWNPSDVEEIFTSDKENLPFDAPLIRSSRKTDQDNMKNELVLKSSKSISNEDGDEIFTPNKETWMGADTEVDSYDNDNHAIDSALKDLCLWTPNGVQEIFTPDKDILACDTPLIRSLRKPDQGNMNVLILKSGKSFSDEERDETFTPDKENITPDTFRSKVMKKMRKIVLRGENSCRSSLKNVTNLHIEYQKPVFNNENHVPKSVTKYVASSFGEHEDEIFTPDKENITPDTFLSKSIKKMRELDEIKDTNFLGSSPLRNMTGSNCHGESCVVTASNRKNQDPTVLLGQKCSNAICSIGAKQTLQSISPRGEEDGVAYQSLHVEPTLKTAMKDQGQNDPMRTRSKESINHPLTQPVRNTATRVENTSRWTMVVDTASLLKKESRQALTLLQGVKRTKLIVPSTVMRELYSIKRCGGFFKRMNEASSALQWIEDCMEDANWWIHVESYAKEASEIATTPPVTPLSWFRGENRMFSTNWFSPSDTLLDNTSPTSDDHILECALLARTSMNGRLVLLSDDVTLKIKAMAEGLLCESAEQFREGLVNPFSERSLWGDSSPRGLTWSCMDDVVLREKFYSGPLKNLTTSGQAVKGLKLILLQNSQDRKLTPPPISSMA